MDLSIFKTLENIENNEFIEFLNTLHYTFLLDIDKDWLCTDVSSSEWVDTLLLRIEDSIQNLYHSKGFNNFLGVPSYDKGICTNTGDASFFQLIYSSEMWSDNIKYHAVLSSLYNIESFLCAGKNITGYELANKYESKGFLRRRFESQKAINTDDPSNLGNRICSQIDTLKSHLSSEEINDLIGSKYGSSYRRIRELHSDIVWRLIQCRVYNIDRAKADEELSNKKAYGNNLFMGLHKKYKSPDQAVYVNKEKLTNFIQMIDLIDQVQDLLYRFDFNASNIYQRVDYLLYLYKLERFYNLSLTRTLFEAIYYHDEKYLDAENKINGDSILSSLLGVFQLPNVFSREIFVKYLFESFENNFNANFFDNDMENRNVGMAFADTTVKDINKRYAWERLVQYFCRYFNNLVFPLTEGLFMASIMRNFDFTSDESQDKCLHDLTNYLNTNFDLILNPTYHSDGNIICRTKFRTDPKIPENFKIRELGLSKFTDSSTFDKKKVNYYNDIFSFLMLHQSNIIHLDSRYKKTISRDAINIWPAENALSHKKLSSFYINEAISRK